jgi:pimeloyl-ACP methyl ester carboxylesterase
VLRRTSISVLGAALGSRVTRVLGVALGLALATATASPTPAAALTPVVFSPCSTASGFSCATLSVPLDQSAPSAGSVGLNIERLQSRSTPSSTAVIALAGGPGQAALPLAAAMAKQMAPALGSRDLLVFDQRGTGSSGPLACSALEGSEIFGAIGPAFERCALQIGGTRGDYTTQESVTDIEAIRLAGGYQKLVLFGVSYGTKVALEYAERYPRNVEALVLDSVVPPERSDPFSLSTLQAMKPVFEELCSAGACAGITSNPLADVARLATQLREHALSGYVYDGSGHHHRSTLSNVDLLNLIVAGDLNPALRALLPASIQSALHGDPAPLLRLNLLSEGLIPNLPGTPLASSDGVDEALFIDTTCEEASFPWQRSAPPSTRLAQALGALHALPATAFYPFDASVAWADSVLPGCALWPNVAPAPPATGPLPSVPTLILSGAQDLRTPTSGAEAVAARIPGAQLLVVPYTGHSVIGTDFSGCAQAAVTAFFTSGSTQPCKPTKDPFAPTPVTPAKLKLLKAVGGVPGRAGSTLAAVLDTIVDLERQVIGATLQADQELPSGSSFGGLRGGYAQITSSALRLHGLSFVSGVRLTGNFAVSGGHLQPANLRVEGSQAAHGTIRIGTGSHVSGSLDGQHFNVDLAKVKLASISGTDAGLARLGLDLHFPTPALARTR